MERIEKERDSVGVASVSLKKEYPDLVLPTGGFFMQDKFIYLLLQVSYSNV